MKKRLGVIFYIGLFLVVEIIFGYFILESRHLFVENSIKNGGYLAQAQTEKIETRMEEYTFAVELAGKYLDEMIDTDTPDEQMQQWMKSYCEKITGRFGDNVLDLYAVLDGRIVAARPWEGDDSYDFASRSWYSDAIEAKPDTIVFSELYQDVITGGNVFTMSLALSNPGDVVAMDIYLTSENWMGFSELADGYGMLVYDRRQTLAYSIGEIDLEAVQEDILANTSDEVSHYAGSSQEKYNFYVCRLSSGWSAVIAIPSENLLSQNHMFFMDLGLGLNVMNMVIAVVFLIWNLRNSRYLRQDSLTGLLNKSYMIKRIRRNLSRSSGTLLIADLDNFKNLNDNYGHDHGDLVIVQVAEVLRICFRKTDYVGRFGGDEFIVYVDEALTDDVLEEKAGEVIRRVDMLSRQYPLSNLAISIGGTRCEKGERYVEVFKRADEAMYRVKNSGKCGFSMSHYR